MRKKPIVLAIVLTMAMLVFAMTAVAQQDGAVDYQATFKLDEPGYVVNGTANTMDVATFAEEGRIYVPFRYLGYALGVAESNVTWDDATKTATLTLGDVTEKFTVGSATYYVNDVASTMDVAPLARDGRIFLPARYVAEDFGFQVAWDAETKTVIVTGAAPEQPQEPSVVDDVYGDENDADDVNGEQTTDEVTEDVEPDEEV